MKHNYFNDETNLYVKFDYEISKIVNEIPRTIKNVVSYQQKTSYFVVPKVFLISGGRTNKLLINWFVF